MLPSWRSVRTRAPPVSATLPPRASRGGRGDRVGTGQVVAQRPDRDRLAHLAGHDVRLGDPGHGLSGLRLLDEEGQLVADRVADAVGDGVLHLDLAALRGRGEADPAARGHPSRGATGLAADGLGGRDGDRVAVLLVPPVGQHRHVEHAACRHRPVAVLEALAEMGRGVGRARPRRDRHGGMGRDLGPAVVDVVLEGRARRAVVGHGQLERLPVRADGHLCVGAADLLDRADREDPAARCGVVVERVEHGGSARARAEAVRLGLRRPPVSLVLLLVLVVLVVLLDPGPEVLPVVHPGRLPGVDVPDPATGPVVEDDLAAVDPEHQVGGGAVELGHVGLSAAAHRRDGPGPAGPRAVDAVTEPDRSRRPAGDAVDDGADVAGPEIHLEQRLAGRDENRTGARPGLLEH